MPWILGIDTSNYTTSAAAYHWESGQVVQDKKLLPVREGALGLRQSDAVFAHVVSLGQRISNIVGQVGEFAAIGVSTRPRDVEGSYMPCFLVGKLVADSLGASHGIPVFEYSHQAGHIAAALYSAGAIELLEAPFLAFHLSGGTTECVLVTPSKTQRVGEFSVELLYTSSDLYAGQAVDRVGKMLGLPFPAGPALEKLAQGSAQEFHPRPYFDDQGNPSLSGVENQCKNMLDKGASPEDIAKYCLAYISQVVQGMTQRARERYPKLPLLYAGGVMSNRWIQAQVGRVYDGLFAAPQFSADNGAGVAVLAAMDYQKTQGGTK